jgi:hypothetical protein
MKSLLLPLVIGVENPGSGVSADSHITTACSGRDMDKVPLQESRQRAADAGR